MDRPTRGRVKKADLLPDSIRNPLLEMLREKRLTQVQIREEVNRLIEEAGLPAQARLSAAGISRLAAENEAVARDLRELREQSKALVAELGDKPTGETSSLILELARSMLFRKIRAAASSAEDDNDIDIGFIKNAMLAVQRLESAAERSLKREKEIRAAFAEEAANAVSDELRGQDGMSEILEQRIRDVLLGKA
ncbi:DUF3486 family protein [Salmonella enterica]|uniref:DUF3486 family protein n=1 Tax=Salmonella enterica TaxID=28901 RepID=A0A747DHA4_SALER|nr:phage protein Gp27 family protein [Salmonella enterica]EBO8546227.1 DUF3486 family protein [Salmonella enterica subsp. enterica serovar Senftenberg]EBP4103961.1 DUF3486 family protein [Salmonella enterica subsp. enterica]ECO0964154.1 DUF3486 family protein [Salmonella enterica subsp. enterica serovar Give]EDW1890378.1 DUF3486 family protein [Salmonella enterica subsp. enterica serovar Abaetetuba]EHH2059661.1 DUF3486 family protein [Salmonella enterica subsp. enterica serovar Oranienburg]